MKEIIVIDCQHDFIDGSLACAHSNEAVKNIISFINANPDAKIYYSADWHSPKHYSFKANGGTWPVHCEAGTHGAEIHEDFMTGITSPAQRPNAQTIYYKGMNDAQEEYSAFNAKNEFGHELNQDAGDNVTVCGIASEFCVRESVIDLLKSGRKVEVPEQMLAWVDEAGHKKNIAELKEMGASIA